MGVGIGEDSADDFEAIEELDQLLQRMDLNQHKKTPQLRRLKSW
jgi:hypothetical protein